MIPFITLEIWTLVNAYPGGFPLIEVFSLTSEYLRAAHTNESEKLSAAESVKLRH